MKHKYIFLLGIICIYFLFNEIKNDMINCAMTSLSIIFGFNMAYMSAIYTNEKFNKILKQNKQLTPFLTNNKKFLYSIIYVLIGVFVCSMIGNATYNINIEKTLFENITVNIKLQIQLYLLAVVGTLYIFIQTAKSIDDFIIVYKNSYSNYLEKKLNK